MEESNRQCEFKVSRNGLTVPVIRGVHLHSIYNPIKEAEAFAEGYVDTLKEKSHILVLGLGFGYHIEQLAKGLNKNHDNYKIVVVEPNREIVKEFFEKRPFEDTSIQIVSPKTVQGLFEDKEFVDFLRSKPAIIKHDTSFAIEKDFYVSLLKYQAPTFINKYYSLLNDEAQAYFGDYIEEDVSLDKVTEDIKTVHGIKNKFDYALLALEEIVNSNKSRGL
tara:strand:- start:866 stop:1525 length:660 start_codon:yes stop_codon:yes gene_type:complete